MDRLLQVIPDDDWGFVGGIVAQHKWGLPGVNCTECGETWAQTGVIYPSVDLSAVPGEKQYRNLSPVSLEELKERKRLVLGNIPEGTLLRPGTRFGPLVGLMRGNFSDFAWQNPWTLLVQAEALARLHTVGIKLPKSTRALLKSNKTDSPEFFELELEPRTLMDPSAFSARLPQCKACGRVDVEFPERIVIRRSSIPSDVDIFRDRLITTLILANDRFVEGVERLGLSGVRFQEVEVTGSD